MRPITFAARLAFALALSTTSRATSTHPPAPPSTVASTVSFNDSPALAIPDGGSVSRTIFISGTGPYLWDVDVGLNVSHTVPGTLDVRLTAPDGRVVTLTTGNGGASANFFAPTLFDDSALLAANHYDTSIYPVPPIAVTPEGAFASLSGMDPLVPNSAWKLTVTDTVTDFVTGTLNSWDLEMTTLNVAPAARQGPFAFWANPNRPIPDNGSTMRDPIIAGGTGAILAEVRVYAQIVHPAPGQLEIELLAPSGRIIPLSIRNGGSNANVFNGTTWRDGARNGLADETCSDHVYAPNVTALDLVPDGALGASICEDPEANWTLRIRDVVPGQTGTLKQWKVECWTYDAPVTSTVCNPGVSSSGCTGLISAVGTPSASGTGTFMIRGTGIDNFKNGLVFYGINGTKFTAWGPSSYYCVKAPVQRTQAANSGGSPPPAHTCDGMIEIDWNAFVVGNPNALGCPFAGLGEIVTAQVWWRDPASPKTTQLTNALQFGVGP